MERTVKEEYKMGRDVEFAVLSSDGATPEIEVHSAGFRESDGIACATYYNGDTQGVANVIGNMAFNFVNSAKERQGLKVAGAMMKVIETILHRAMTPDEMRTASRMIIADMVKDAVEAGVLDEDEVESLMEEEE